MIVRQPSLKTVVCWKLAIFGIVGSFFIIHFRPRYSLFTLFDHVLLLGMGGRTVYLGQSEGALPYFRNLGYKMPEHETLGVKGCDGENSKERNQHVLVSNCWKGRGFRVATLRVLDLKYLFPFFFIGVPLDQGWAVSHEGYPEVLWIQHVFF